MNKSIAHSITMDKKVDKLNKFYLRHKKVIDEFFRLQGELSNASSKYVITTINNLLGKYSK